jgi:hypothetical protein
VEERIAADIERDHLRRIRIGAAETHRVEATHGVLGDAVLGAEGSKVMLADQVSGALGHRVDVQQRAAVPGTGRPARRAVGARQDEVAVLLARAREAGMELVVHVGGVDHGDRRRQVRVEPLADAVGGDRPLGAEARDLAAGVDARVGPRGAPRRGALADQLLDRVLEVALHRRRAVLTLPAREAGPVVLEDQADVALGHAAARTGPIRTRS